MYAKRINEAELARHLDRLIEPLGLRRIASEVSIGAYRLDAVAEDASGVLRVIELKVNASLTTLGQLLLYPTALDEALRAQGMTPPMIRAMLITTHLDANVIASARRLQTPSAIEFRICTGDTAQTMRLIRPEEADSSQVWSQSRHGGVKIGPIIAHLSSRNERG